MSVGTGQILVILLIIVILFGAGNLPKFMADFAKGLKEFKKNLKEEDKDNRDI